MLYSECKTYIQCLSRIIKETFPWIYNNFVFLIISFELDKFGEKLTASASDVDFLYVILVLKCLHSCCFLIRYSIYQASI